jgi:hypothetical protein
MMHSINIYSAQWFYFCEYSELPLFVILKFFCLNKVQRIAKKLSPATPSPVAPATPFSITQSPATPVTPSPAAPVTSATLSPVAPSPAAPAILTSAAPPTPVAPVTLSAAYSSPDSFKQG